MFHLVTENICIHLFGKTKVNLNLYCLPYTLYNSLKSIQNLKIVNIIILFDVRDYIVLFVFKRYIISAFKYRESFTFSHYCTHCYIRITTIQQNVFVFTYNSVKYINKFIYVVS